MTKIKIIAGDDLFKTTSAVNEFIENEVDHIQDIKYESFPIIKKYSPNGIPIECVVLDRILIMYEPKQEDQEDGDCEFCSLGEMLDSLTSTLRNFSKKEKENKEFSDENNKQSYNPVEKAYKLVKDLHGRVSCMELYYEDRCIISGHLEEILGYLGEALK